MSFSWALECAAGRRQSEGTCYIVKRCLHAGADPHKLWKNGLSAIHMASRLGSVEIARVLLQHDSTLSQARDSRDWTALHYAAQSGEGEIVDLLVNQIGADINARARRDEGLTALHVAVMEGNCEIAKQLLHHGADACFIAKKGFSSTVLHLAAILGNPEITAILLNHVARLHIRDRFGRMPLHWAAQYGNMRVVELLLDYGADIHAVDIESRKAIHVAAKWGRKDVVSLLTTKHSSAETSSVTKIFSDAMSANYVLNDVKKALVAYEEAYCESVDNQDDPDRVGHMCSIM